MFSGYRQCSPVSVELLAVKDNKTRKRESCLMSLLLRLTEHSLTEVLYVAPKSDSVLAKNSKECLWTVI
jgi:hypothetical protein